jgi:hypothetical protein
MEGAQIGSSARASTQAARLSGMARKSDPIHEQLLQMIPHIAYDLVQMLEVAKVLPKGRPARTIAENALIDGMLVYARKLLVFMDPPSRKDWREGDVYACDYIDGWQIPPSWWAHSNPEVMKAISTRAAHICLARIERIGWNTDAIAGSIAEAMLSFIKQLDDQYRDAFVASPNVVTLLGPMR